MTSNDFAYITSTYLRKFLPGIRNLSTNTITSYGTMFIRLLQYASEVKSIPAESFTLEHLTDDLVYGYLQWMSEKFKCSRSTQRLRLAAIHTFIRFLIPRYPMLNLQFQKVLEVRVRHPAQTEVPHLEMNAIAKLLSLPDTNTVNGLRDLAMISLMYDGALRVQELCDVKVGDIRLARPGIIRVTGKGNKTATVELIDATISVISSYVTATRKTADDYLFTNHQGGKFTRVGVSYILNKYGRLAKATMPEFPDHIHPHMLRHSKATHLVNNGTSMLVVKEHLRHAELATTQIYAKINPEQKRKIIAENGLNLIPENALKDWHSNKVLMSELREICKPNHIKE